MKNGFYDDVALLPRHPRLHGAGRHERRSRHPDSLGTRQHQRRSGQAEQQARLRDVREDRGAEFAIDADLHQLRRQREPRLAGLCAVRPGDLGHGGRRQVRRRYGRSNVRIRARSPTEGNAYLQQAIIRSSPSSRRPRSRSRPSHRRTGHGGTCSSSRFVAALFALDAVRLPGRCRSRIGSPRDRRCVPR